MGLIGLFQTLIGFLLTQTEAALAASLIDEQVDVVARHFGVILLEMLQCGYSYF